MELLVHRCSLSGTSLFEIFNSLSAKYFVKVRKKAKIRNRYKSSTTPDPGHRMGKLQKHKGEPRDQATTRLQDTDKTIYSKDKHEIKQIHKIRKLLESYMPFCRLHLF